MGLANRLVRPGTAQGEALALAGEIASRPQGALRTDRLASYEQWSMALPAALLAEYERGLEALRSGELRSGLEHYASGSWRVELGT
jgi:enoyl-CoA hydratase/carnithine racemase